MSPCTYFRTPSKANLEGIKVESGTHNSFLSHTFTNCIKNNELAKDELTHLGRNEAYYHHSLIVESLENSGSCPVKQAVKACMALANSTSLKNWGFQHL